MTLNPNFSIREEVVQTVKRYSRNSEIEITDQTLIRDLGIDSLDIMEVVFHVEDKHGIKIDDHKLSDIKSVSELIILVSETIDAGVAQSA